MPCMMAAQTSALNQKALCFPPLDWRWRSLKPNLAGSDEERRQCNWSMFYFPAPSNRCLQLPFFLSTAITSHFFSLCDCAVGQFKTVFDLVKSLALFLMVMMWCWTLGSFLVLSCLVLMKGRKRGKKEGEASKQKTNHGNLPYYLSTWPPPTLPMEQMTWYTPRPARLALLASCD